jgi:DNA-binding NarL/FixJ family response regulator
VERHARVSAASPRAPQVVVFSDRHLIAEGLVDMLPEGWRDRTVSSADLDVLEQAVRGSLRASVIDADAVGAERAAALASARGASVIVLIGSVADQLAESLLNHADAVLVRDEVDPRILQLAFAAGRVGMRLLPRALVWHPPSAPAAPVHEPLGMPAHRALELLADGMRDAEIAVELSLSESAVRKLIQRTLKRSGARTRCEAVATAIRDGELG